MRRLLKFLIVVLVVAVGIVLYFFERDIGAARARVAGHSQSVETQVAPIEYAEAGKGPPVLVIHGSGGGYDQGLETTAPLAARGYHLIAPSRFGYLASSYPPNASPELQADAFADFLDRLGLDKAFIFGGSAGALSAMQLAIRHPERCLALVLLVPATYAPERRPNTSAVQGPAGEALMRTLLNSDFIFWLGMRLAPGMMTRVLLATEPAIVTAADPAEQARVRDVLEHILPVSVRASGLLLDMRTAGNPPSYALDRIACPVLAISAEDDLYGTAVSARYAASQVKDGRVIVFPTGGHLLVGRGDEVWSAVAAFLAAHAQPPGG
jgi:pimeloyl-ACP methyl ester carboxylesterase